MLFDDDLRLPSGGFFRGELANDPSWRKLLRDPVPARDADPPSYIGEGFRFRFRRSSPNHILKFMKIPPFVPFFDGFDARVLDDASEVTVLNVSWEAEAEMPPGLRGEGTGTLLPMGVPRRSGVEVEREGEEGVEDRSSVSFGMELLRRKRLARGVVGVDRSSSTFESSLTASVDFLRASELPIADVARASMLTDAERARLLFPSLTGSTRSDPRPSMGVPGSEEGGLRPGEGEGEGETVRWSFEFDCGTVFLDGDPGSTGGTYGGSGAKRDSPVCWR